jgi:imidazole glycerol-phosphate synthase subunit HisF
MNPTTMLTTRVIPCLDVRDGRVVKGVRFQSLRDAGDPAALAAAYEAAGADEIVILDVSATPEGRRAAPSTIAAVRSVLSIPLTVGGGVRTRDDAARLLDAGADRVGVNTAAVDRPELISEIARDFGVQCVVLAVDAARRSAPADHAWQVVVRSGTSRLDLDAPDWCARGQSLGAGEILLTSWDRDGTRQGYDLELLRAVAARVGIPIVASGGAASAGDLIAAVRAGADAVLAASIFHDNEHSVHAVKLAMRSAGVEVRL